MSQQMHGVRQEAPLMSGLARPVIVSAVLFMVITGLVYPLVTTGVAELVFPRQAQGDIITRDGKAIGSAVIGQWFTKPDYFQPRPSATTGTDPKDPSKTVPQPYNAANSGASNLAATSKSLIDTVTSRAAAYRKDNGLAADVPVPADAVTASGSGLDPDISVQNAQIQAKRVATARGMSERDVLRLVDEHTRGPQFGVIGYSRVNVLELNIALDNQAPHAAGK